MATTASTPILVGLSPAQVRAAGVAAKIAARKAAQRQRREAARAFHDRLDVLLAETPVEALPFGAEVSIWHSANDGCLKWAVSFPSEGGSR